MLTPVDCQNIVGIMNRCKYKGVQEAALVVQLVSKLNKVAAAAAKAEKESDVKNTATDSKRDSEEHSGGEDERTSGGEQPSSGPVCESDKA